MGLKLNVRAANGLSPLARGTHYRKRPDHHDHRFIPAGAGNTSRRTGPRTAKPVYPRWRGEHIDIDPVAADMAGLSPLARGTPFRESEYYCGYRFIPAGAGNTHSREQQARALAVYPRWRGEHDTSHYEMSASGGLSPLARGTQRPSQRLSQTARFIPAGAGNTKHSRSLSTGKPVYPRWRGEHCIPIADIPLESGLSPLARGTLTLSGHDVSNWRFIPAGAGNTGL